MEDWGLLQKYAKSGSEAAFTALVDRHMDLVYSTALRRLKDPQAAQEVSQAVFSLLAQKAYQLRSDTAFVSWLYRTTCFKAAKYCRAEWRRRKREQEAADMQSVEPGAENIWDLVLPHLDEAMAQLSEADRLAILLRFSQRKALKDIGVTLGIGEDAARMRVNRALDKLHTSLIRKGVAISTVALAGEMIDKTIQATPSESATLVRQAAIEAAKAASIPSLLTTILILMANTKLKTGVAMAVVLLAGSTGLFLMNRNAETRGVEASQALVATEAEPAISAQEPSVQPSTVPRSETSEKAQQLQNLIANLKKAMGEEAVVSEGNRFSYPVAAAVVAFGAYKSLAVPTLLEGITGTNELVRMNAYLGMGYIDEAGKEAMPQLLKWANDRDERAEVRVAALNALQNIAQHAPSLGPEMLRDLVEMFNDPTVRGYATRTLGSMGSYARDAVPALIDLLSYEAGKEEAVAQLKIEGRSDIEIEENRVSQRMANLTQNVRISAAEALQGIGPEASSAIPMLELLLQDADKDVRASAAIAVWKITGRTDGVPAIMESLSIANQVRTDKALAALGEMGPAAASAISAVEHLTRYTDSWIRDPALRALRKIDPTRPAPPWIRSN